MRPRNKNLIKIIGVMAIGIIIVFCVNGRYNDNISKVLKYIENNNYVIKDKVLNFLGINIYNPTSILEKEISFIAMDVDIEAKKEAAWELNPFVMNEASINKESLENKDDVNTELKKNLDKSKPEVLIYHSHNQESYGEEAYSRDNSKNIVSVGNELAKNLEENYGISVIHDKTIHDELRSNAYTKSGETLDKYLSKYKDFKIIIDIHRDSGPSKASTTTKVNGEDVAKFMLVISKRRPNINKNMKLVNELINISNKLYPGFCSGTFTYGHGINGFNQDKNSNLLLVEVGTEKNTSKEAQLTGKYIARILAESINKKK